MKYKNIIVTGGSGLVGTSLKKIMPDSIYLSSKDYNLTLEKDVERMYSDLNPSVVIHMAARVGGIIDNINKPVQYFEDNIIMNSLLIKHAYKNNVARFIGILSSCIYPDNSESYPLAEECLHDGPPTETNFYYGISKRSMAVHIDAYNKQYGTKYNYLIPTNLYGESDKDDIDKSHYVTALVKKIYESNMINSNKITLFGDGTPMRQFMDARDMANIIKIVVDHDITESFNVSTEENFTIDEIARIAIKSTGSNLSIEYDKSKPNGQQRKDVDISKLKKLIPDYKFIKLEDGIKDLYKSYVNRNK